MSTPLQIWGNASLKLRSGATSAKMSGFKDGVTKWDHSPAGQNPRCTPKVHGFWTKLSERSMLNYPGVAQRKIALSGRSQKMATGAANIGFSSQIGCSFLSGHSRFPYGAES